MSTAIDEPKPGNLHALVSSNKPSCTKKNSLDWWVEEENMYKFECKYCGYVCARIHPIDRCPHCRGSDEDMIDESPQVDAYLSEDVSAGAIEKRGSAA